MTNLSAKQTALLQQVRMANESLRVAKRTADLEARIIVADRIAEHEAALDHIVRLAFEAEIPKSRIGREGLQTTNSTTVANILKRTAQVAEALVAANNPMNKRYQFESDQVRVTLTADEARDVLVNFGQEADNPPLSALFERRLGGWWPVAVTGMFDGAEHPLSLWSASDANRAELAEWAEAHTDSRRPATAETEVSGPISWLDDGDDD